MAVVEDLKKQGMWTPVLEMHGHTDRLARYGRGALSGITLRRDIWASDFLREEARMEKQALRRQRWTSHVLYKARRKEEEEEKARMEKEAKEKQAKKTKSERKAKKAKGDKKTDKDGKIGKKTHKKAKKTSKKAKKAKAGHEKTSEESVQMEVMMID